MYPLVFAALGAALLAFWLAVVQPRDLEAIHRAQADVYAANFWIYRGALVAYQNDNFAAAPYGYIPDAALSAPMAQRPTGYFPLGYKIMQTGTPAIDLWKNHFEGGTLYTYTTIPARDLPTGVIDAIANRNGRSLMIGVKQGNGTATSMFRLDTPPNTGTSFTLPPTSGIPVGALVVVGN